MYVPLPISASPRCEKPRRGRSKQQHVQRQRQRAPRLYLLSCTCRHVSFISLSTTLLVLRSTVTGHRAHTIGREPPASAISALNLSTDCPPAQSSLDSAALQTPQATPTSEGIASPSKLGYCKSGPHSAGPGILSHTHHSDSPACV